MLLNTRSYIDHGIPKALQRSKNKDNIPKALTFEIVNKQERRNNKDRPRQVIGAKIKEALPEDVSFQT
jgi:hypothetical protein